MQRQDLNVLSHNTSANIVSDQNYQACQRTAPLDLKVVSWPRGKVFRDLKCYEWDATAGNDAVIYILEEGIDRRHPVCNYTLLLLPFLFFKIRILCRSFFSP